IRRVPEGAWISALGFHLSRTLAASDSRGRLLRNRPLRRRPCGSVLQEWPARQNWVQGIRTNRGARFSREFLLPESPPLFPAERCDRHASMKGSDRPAAASNAGFARTRYSLPEVVRPRADIRRKLLLRQIDQRTSSEQQSLGKGYGSAASLLRDEDQAPAVHCRRVQ